jgi:tRNA A37 methylthiotransferase MiaB
LSNPPAANGVELGWLKHSQPTHHRQLLGRTRGDQIVAVTADPALKGRLIQARITRASQMTLFGEMVEG